MKDEAKAKTALITELQESRQQVAKLQGIVSDNLNEHENGKEQLYHQTDLLKHVSDAIITTDLKFNITSWNRAAETIYGWSAEEVIGKRVSEAIPTAYPATIREKALQRLREDGHWQGEVIQKRKDGESILIFASISMLTDDDGNEIGAVAVNRDVTERTDSGETLLRNYEKLEKEVSNRTGELAKEVDRRQIAEEELRDLKRALRDSLGEYEATLKALTNSNRQLEAEIAECKQAERERDHFFSLSIDLLCISSPDGHIKHINPAWEKTLGFSIKELKSKPAIEFVHPDDRAATRAAAERLTAGGEIVSFENRYRCQDGSYRWIWWNAGFHESDQLIYAVARDVTKQRRAEKELKRKQGLIQLLQEVAVGANEATDAIAALQTTLDLVCDYFGWPVGHVYFRHESDDEIIPTTIWYTDQPQRFEKFRRISLQTQLSLDNSLIGIVFDQCRTTWVTDVTQDPLFIRAEIAEEVGLKSGIAFPVLVGKKAAAVLEFFTEEPVEQDELLLDALGQIGAQLGRVIEREQAEIAIRASEKLHRTMVRHFPRGAVVLFDHDLRYQIAEGQGLADVGLSTEMLEGKTIWEVFPPETCELIEPVYRAALAGQATVGEVPYKDRVYITYTVPVRIEQDEIYAGMVVTQDITPLKETEALLQRNEALLRSIFQHSPIGIALASDGQILQSNQAVQKLLGYSAEELRQLPYVDLIHPDDRAESQQYVKAVAEQERQSFNIETRFLTKGGQAIWAHTMVSTIRGQTRELPHHTLFVIQDITERRRFEAERTELVEKLKAVNQELNDFAYVVSHDLKAPLRAIGSLANWISADYSDKLDEDGQEQMQLLIERVHRMNRLIEGILQHSRIGRVKETQEKVDLNKLVAEVIDSCAPPDKIDVTVENQLPTLVGERTRFGQIFQNLITNAIAYGCNAIKQGAEAEGNITIGCEDNGDFWLFRVADDGVGIEERHFGKIFQIFQTLAPRDEVESTGVGLALVKKIVEQYGGEIWLESNVGEGSIFFFTLPKDGTEVHRDLVTFS